MKQLRFTILGCGSSGGVPRLGGNWGKCDPANPRNNRWRCSLLIEQAGSDGVTRVLIDSSPDLRSQLLDAKVGWIDGLLYSHHHADHVNGLDDLRAIYLNRGSRIPVWADSSTRAELFQRFNYAFVWSETSTHAPILRMNPLVPEVTIEGKGGTVRILSFRVGHGPIDSNGFRIASLAYIPDVSRMYESSWEAIDGVDVWIVDSLRRAPHPSHSHLSQTLEWVERAGPKLAILTNLHNDLDYETVREETPPNVVPAYDGMQIECSPGDADSD